MSNQQTIDMVKVAKVIKSCATLEQLNVAQQMIVNFVNVYDKPGGDVPDFSIFYIAAELTDVRIKQKRKLEKI